MSGELPKAKFICRTPPNAGETVEVHFNPASLQYTVTNTLKQRGSNRRRQRDTRATQQIDKSSGKLTIDLVFDTTDTGANVCNTTSKFIEFMKPVRRNAQLVEFKWGHYSFKGMLESFKETIDFFASSGVPLRASVNVSMAEQDIVFEAQNDPGANVSGELSNIAGETPNLRPPFDPTRGAGAQSSGQGNGQQGAGGLPTSGLGAGAGAFAGASASVGAGAFAGASASVGAGAFAGAGASVGTGAFAGAGASFGTAAGSGVGISSGAIASASAGLSMSSSAQFGGTASVGGLSSAGVTASAGAFRGLKVDIKQTKVISDFSEAFQISNTATLGTDAGASFGLGGQAIIEGSLSIKADVGGSGDLQARIQFDED